MACSLLVVCTGDTEDGEGSGEGPDPDPDPLARLFGLPKYPESVGSMTVF